jgi:hypothetical protein
MENHYSIGNRFYFLNIIDIIKYASVITTNNKSKYLEMNDRLSSFGEEHEIYSFCSMPEKIEIEKEKEKKKKK